MEWEVVEREIGHCGFVGPWDIRILLLMFYRARCRGGCDVLSTMRSAVDRTVNGLAPHCLKCIPPDEVFSLHCSNTLVELLSSLAQRKQR